VLKNKKSFPLTRRSLLGAASSLLASWSVTRAFAGERPDGGDDQATATGSGSIAFDDPSRPGTVEVRLPWGEIAVRGHDGDKVEVDMRASFDPVAGEDDDGAPRLSLEQADGRIRVWVSPPTAGGFWSADLELRVPRGTSVALGMERGGNIRIADLAGRVEVDSENGSVALHRVSGGARVDCRNGEIEAHFEDLSGGDPIRLATGNGKVDVSLPAAARADLSLRSPNGGAFSDFEIDKESGDLEVERPIREDLYRKYPDGGHFDGSLNGGGRPIELATDNGPILIRRLG